MNIHQTLGYKIKDKVSGDEGYVLEISIWLNGCERVGYYPCRSHNGQPVAQRWIDFKQCLILPTIEPIPTVPAEFTMRLGDKVKDIVSGLDGTIVAYAIRCGGLVQVGVQTGHIEDGSVVDAFWTNQNQIEVLEVAEIQSEDGEPPAGPVSSSMSTE